MGAEIDTLLKLTLRYCVVYQTLAGPVELSETVAVTPGPSPASARVTAP